MKRSIARGWLLMAALALLAPALAGQDILPLPPGGEPPPYPPEPPAQTCGFSYFGYIQTSQGVLQDDPQDSNFLQVVKGTSTLSRNLASAKQAFDQTSLQYQVPTLEAGIDMVVGRESYLLAANPYTVRGRQSLEAGREAVLHFQLRGSSAYSAQVPVHLRITAVLNGRVVKQFLANDPNSPKTVRLGGSCAQPPLVPGGELLYSEPDVMLHARNGISSSVRFYFDEPGRYLVRAELVRDEKSFRYAPAYLKPVGVAVDVRGQVVQTRTPSLLVVPAVGVDAYTPEEGVHAAFAGHVQQHLVPGIRLGVQYGMATPSGPATTTFDPGAALFGQSYESIAAGLGLALRYSPPVAQPDRIVVIVEDEWFDLFRPTPLWDDSGLGFAPSNFKKIVFVRGPRLEQNPALGYHVPPLSPARKRRLTENVIHMLYHSLGWNPETASEMGDCQVAPYHPRLPDQNVDASIANGIELAGLLKYPYFGYPALMGPTPTAEILPKLAGQCTYRYSLAKLSAAKIDPPVLMISGVVRGPLLSSEVELAPVYAMDGFGELPADGEGSWKILLRDADGDLLASHPFEPDFTVEGGLLGEVYFNYTVERPPGVDRIEITQPRYVFGAPPQDAVVASRQLSDHAPTLDASAFRFLSQWIVDWDGYDADGDPLLYTVLTSTDGGLYLPTEIFESSQTGLTIDDPYGTIRHLKVVATDGGRSVVETIDL